MTSRLIVLFSCKACENISELSDTSDRYDCTHACEEKYLVIAVTRNNGQQTCMRDALPRKIYSQNVVPLSTTLKTHPHLRTESELDILHDYY